MRWYDKHIESGEDVLRPYIEENGLEVHKVMTQIEDGKIPQEVVQNYYDLDNFLTSIEEGDIDSDIEVNTTDSFSLPELNVEHVEAAIEFTRDNTKMINDIIEEQETLTEAMLAPAEDAHQNIQKLDLEYFEVDSSLEYDDGTPVVEFEYGQ